MDTFSKEFRSQIMRAVKSRGNKSTELALIGLFKKHSIIGWRRKAKVFGNPDFFFPKLKLVVFADGCFWHGCKCKTNSPKTNVKYWKKKIKRNIARDKLVNKELKEQGYLVVRIKECQIKKGALPKRLKMLFAS